MKPTRIQHFLQTALVALLLPLTAWADGTESSSNYLVMMTGMDQLQIQMPIYDQDGYDGWIDKGYIYVTPAGGIKQTLLYYYSEEKSGANPLLHYQKGVDGAMTLIPGNNAGVTVSTEMQSCRVSSSSDVFKVTVLWTVPETLRGMELTVSWSIHKKGNGDNITGEKDKNISISPTKVTLPAVPAQIKPSLMEPMLGYDAAHAGQTMLIYTMAASEVTSLIAHYTEVNGRTETKVSKYLEPEMSGFIYLDADRCYKDFCLEAHYLDTEDRARVSFSDSVSVPTLHQPIGLTAELQADGQVVLRWRCRDTRWSDIVASDNWEIQRNTSGAPDATAQWQSIEQLAFLSSDDVYTYTDQTLTDQYEGRPVYYRVRRASTSIWDWKAGTYAQVALPFTLCLPTLTEARVSQGAWNAHKHEANFTFAFGGPEYDKQGRFILRTAADWESFASQVNAGNTTLNAIMAADIDIGKSKTRVGDFQNSRGYSGTFDGNGHTLTVCYDTIDAQYVAPFKQLASATIRNLHVAGKIVAKQKFAAGLVGNVLSGETLTISNCRVSALVGSTVDGDASNGGFVAFVHGRVKMNNCLFDGQFVGEKSHSTGGFVAVGGTVELSNSLFSPAYVSLSSNFTSCQTLSRAPGASNTITNCYYYTSLDGTATTTIGGKEYLVLHNASDWNTFISRVVSAGGNSDVNAIMANDFNVIYSVGYRENIPFKGTFEGNGHTLGVSINSPSKDYIAPFSRTKDAVIRNLNVVGQVSGAMHASGLVGSSEGSTLRVENCHVSVKVYTTKTHSGGILGHGHKVKNYLRNCLFDGSIEAKTYSTGSYAGAIMGWEDSGTSNVVENNLENATYTNINHAGMNYNASGGGHVYGATNNWNTHNWGECNKVGAMTGAQLVAQLGSEWVSWGSLAVPLQKTTAIEPGTYAYDIDPVVLDTLLNQGNNKNQWQLQGNLPMPVMHQTDDVDVATILWDKSAKVVLYADKSVDGEVRYTERFELSDEERASGTLQHYELVNSCVDHDFRFVVEQSASQLAPIDTVGIKATKAETGEAARYEFDNNVKIDSLMAKTEQSTVGLEWKVSGVGDFFRIIRTDKATEQVDTLEAAYTLNTYIDRTPKPQHVYTYKVEGVNDCEGRHVSVATVDGWCQPTGMVRGYLRLRDGTAIAGRKVTAEPLFDGGNMRSAYTDATGFFKIDSLVYVSQGSYKITAERVGDEGFISDYTANFNEDSNLDIKALLVMDTYYLLSGYVMYDGTSVPVLGAQFERDGEIVHNGSGKPIITDSQGRFSISVPQGQHTIRVVKDGHVFMDGGFYLDENDSVKVNWQKSQHDYVFWDQTRVMLQGRVVGGDVQGNKPYGKLSSVNNLGDSLTIVMQLEGDNASYLVRDQLNASITERHADYAFGTHELDTCHLDTYRHRLVIKPSPVTGEYHVPMLPVRYKVTEIYAEGYPTLFQSGKVGETLDLSGYVDRDTVTYSRIYHSAPTLDVTQYNMMGEDYMGIKSYTDMDNTGKQVSIELWNDSTGYSFGYPVFMAGSPIIMLLSAVEKYYKNNDPKTSAPDMVYLPGGEVRIHNALIDTDEIETVQLDSVGSGMYRFIPQNLTFTEENDMALKTMTMTLLYDSTFYDVKPMHGEPIRGYVMAAKAKSQGRRVVAEGPAALIDILRDPPGASSSAFIEKGTKMHYTFTEDVKARAGLNLNFGKSSGTLNMWNGVWAGEGSGKLLGNTISVTHTDKFAVSLVSTYYNKWQYGYTFETSERISTSSAGTSVGCDADLFIGLVQNYIMEDGIAVRAVSDSTYQLLTTNAGGAFTFNNREYKVPQGTMKLLAQGRDSEGNKVYLVRDEVMKVSSQVKSTFVHSQKYIEKELIPELIKLRNTFILPQGTTEETARAVARQNGYAMYVSHVSPEDEYFGIEGYYTQVDPDDEHAYTDSVHVINDRIITWITFLGTNEKEKLLATDLVKSYDVDGRATVSYSESFGVSKDESRYWEVPLINTGLDGLSFGGGKFGKGQKTGTTDKTAFGDTYDEEDDAPSKTMKIDVFNQGVTVKITPILSLDYNYVNGQNAGESKKVGFTLAPSTNSNLVVDVYRTRMDKTALQEMVDSLTATGLAKNEDKAKELFFQYITDENYLFLRRGGKSGEDFGRQGSLNGVCSYIGNNPTQYRSLVYRTRGGATSQPYEDERRTKYYFAGTVLDAKTIEIDRPRFWVEQASVSNVPYDEPARFILHIANESEAPALATTTAPFKLLISGPSNPNGAKIAVDGMPLVGGLDVFLQPGVVTTKVLELSAGTEYDYDNISLGLRAPNDMNRLWECNISAHFVPTAGKVNISLPGDKWVVNTESQYDSNRQQYYMPVRIDGFDVNYRNFDHIELQYKLSTQGDRDWVNVCSYYKDSLLMAKATGECRLIEDDGHIMATFWGESDPIEQQYDLRAVNYCRHAGGFLTRSSNILTGIKDTRRPQLFGTPKPEDGILGIGDDILLRFSEPIAGNYLRGLNNFQVLGQTNSTNISLSTDLRFDGQGGAQSMSSRNLAGKSFTVEMIISPDRTDQNMTLFSHGDEQQFLELGVTPDGRLSAVFTDDVFVSDPIPFNGLRQVAFVVEADVSAKRTKVTFYDGTRALGSHSIEGLYGGQGTYALGLHQRENFQWESSHYQGEMLEFRLWNRALSLSEMNEYGQKRLTGYELGLMDNFPLNEGQGLYSYNRVPSGGDLALLSTTAAWKVPDGIAMRMDGSRGFRIDPQKFSRTDYQDYSLTFWFRTTDAEGTLLANGPARTEADARNHFNFGVSDGQLLLRLGGQELATNTSVSDGVWHHAALTVSRSRNVGNLYLDNALKKTFAVDTIGGILGSYLAAGATYLSHEEVERPIRGHIDEICMYEMALTENILRATASMTLTGEELGLLAYLSFGRNELQLNNQQQLVPTGISLRRYRDWTTGELTTQRDTLIAQDVVQRLADKASYAPMRGLATLENIPYSFVADGKDLLINLDLPDYQIEKTNVIVTVKDVTDLNGNTMASPVTMDLYVYRNPLRWTAKQISMNIAYGEEHTFQATVQNLSGRSKRFTLQGLPVWITASQYEGIVSALGEQVITFTVSPSINMGDFDETLYLAGEDGMSEPLPVNIKVRGQKPDWAVDELLLRENITMGIIGRVEIHDNVAHDSDDLLAAFNSEHRLLGVTHLDASATGVADEGLFYLNVYNIDRQPIDLYFEFFDASTGTIHKVMPYMEDLTFKKDTVIGTSIDPVVFFTNNGVVQAIPLKEGWNWVSFNVNPQENTVSGILDNATRWEDGDALEIEKTDGERLLITYKTVAAPNNRNKTVSVWDYDSREIELDPALMYRFFSKSDKQAYVSGYLADVASITVKKGWNRIGYISDMNLPIGTALAEYTDQASAGDIFKSQSEFAVLSVDASGNKSWKGTLKYLRVGEGYMLKRNADTEVSFAYPDYFSRSRYGGLEAPRRAPAFRNSSGASMTLVAVALGIDVLPGDRLTAWRDGDVCGVSIADEDGVFYLSVGDTRHPSTGAPQLTFTLERGDELLGATTRSDVSFMPDAAYGTPVQPTAIRFVSAENLDADGWYDLGGRKVTNHRRGNAMLHRGVYIHNHQKILSK